MKKRKPNIQALAEMQVLKDQLAEAKADQQRTRRVAQIAMRDAMRASDTLTGFAHAATAAEYFVATGHYGTAQVILSSLKTAHLDHVRERVSREPGGIHHDPASELPGTPEDGGNGQ